MQLKNTVVVFDLDDTLYYEIDFLKSAYQHIAKLLEATLNKNIYDEMWQLYVNKQSTFDVIKQKYAIALSVDDLVYEYRFHHPTITVNDTTLDVLNWVKQNTFATALITDGRSITQRNKIKALGLHNYFDVICISEETGFQKPELSAFKPIEIKFKEYSKIYIADNPKKDFIIPNQLGWQTVALKNKGYNIHTQNWEVETSFLPHYIVNEISEIKDILNK